MKKLTWFITCLLCVSLIFVLPISVSGAGADIRKGTPAIDGTMDDIYLQSVEVSLGAAFYSTSGDTATDTTGKAYLLWDDDYLYVFADVNDKNVLSADETYVSTDVNPWMNDNVETWFSENMDGTKCKVSVNALGTRSFGTSTPFDISTLQYKTKSKDGGYVAEFAIPFQSNHTAGSEIGFSLQVDDLFADNHVVALGSQVPVAYKLVNADGTGASSIVSSQSQASSSAADSSSIESSQAETSTDVKDSSITVSTQDKSSENAANTGDVSAMKYAMVALMALGGICAFKKRNIKE